MSEKEKSPLVRALVAAVAVVAIPIVAAGAQTGSIVRSNPTNKRTCTVRTTLGTRLGRTVVCQTKAEQDQLKKDGRETVERVQMRRVLPGG